MNKLTLSICVLLTAATGLQAQQQEPIPSIDRMVQKVLGQLFDSSGQARRSISAHKVRNMLGEVVDWDMLVHRAVGKNWSRLTKGEQREIVDLTSQLIVRSYTGQLHGITRPVVTYGRVRSQGANRLTVDTAITIGRRKYKGDYRFVRAGGKWRCYDFLVEGASVVSGYRSQFDSHFRKGNGKQLIEQLRAQL